MGTITAVQHVQGVTNEEITGFELVEYRDGALRRGSTVSPGDTGMIYIMGGTSYSSLSAGSLNVNNYSTPHGICCARTAEIICRSGIGIRCRRW